MVPQANFGKVKTGEKVLLKFQAYPNAEYSSVIGKVAFIAHVPTDNGYLVKVVLPKGLTTNYNKQIQYHGGLVATGEIITAERRLLQQLYQNLYSEVSR